MKTSEWLGWGRAAIFAAFMCGVSARAGEPTTGFAFAKEGNRYIGEQCKDQVVQIRSEKSDKALAPDVWWVVYYDPTAALKAVEVKFGHGKMVDVKRPMRLLEPIGGKDQPLDRDRLKTDSDQALAIARALPEVSRLSLSACQYWLERKETVPVWRIRLWAIKNSDPSVNVELGDIYISTSDGKVFMNKLNVGRAD
jgi:hypothetical protein